MLKMKPLVFTLLILTSLTIFIGCGDQEKPEESKRLAGRSVNFTEGRLTFLSSDAQTDSIATIDIAVADEQMERNEGLMDVTSMPSSAGMLFIFPDEQPRSFWMANTPLPLDIIYANAEQTIIKIHHQTKPFSQEQYPSEVPAKYVVETNGGFCQSNDIREGMRITFSR